MEELNQKLIEIILMEREEEKGGKEQGWKVGVSECTLFCRLDFGARQVLHNYEIKITQNDNSFPLKTS